MVVADWLMGTGSRFRGMSSGRRFGGTKVAFGTTPGRPRANPPPFLPLHHCHRINIHLEHHAPPQRHRRYGLPLLIAMAVAVTTMIVEVWASLRTGSLALLSDAGHMLADISGLILAYVALILASRPATKEASYGYQRYEVLAAAFNGLLLVGLVSVLVWRAIDRLQHPLERLDSITVLWVATLGLFANVVAALLLRKDALENINTKGALLNVLGDAVASVGVMASAAIVYFTGNTRFDTYVTFLVAAIIGLVALRLLRQTAAILLETTPPSVDLVKLKAGVEQLAGVVNVHDLHCWTLTPGHNALTMHVSIARTHTENFHAVIQAIETYLARAWDLHHCTIQLEPVGEDDVSDHYNPVAG